MPGNLRIAGHHHKHEQASKASPKSWRRVTAVLTLRCLPSGLQAWERVSGCHLKAAALCYAVTIAPGKQGSLNLHHHPFLSLWPRV